MINESIEQNTNEQDVRPEPLWDYLNEAYGKPVMELWKVLNEKTNVPVDFWETVLPRFRKHYVNIALILSLGLSNFADQSVYAQEGEEGIHSASINVVCLSDNQSKYCYYMAIALKVLEGPILPTPAPTSTPTPLPTFTPTPTPTPTATPLPPRWYKDQGDSDGSDCGISGCSKIIYFDQLNVCHPVTPVIDDRASNYLGESFNLFPENYRPVLTFHEWDGTTPGFRVDSDFELFVGFNKQPSDYELIVNCGGASN